MVKQRRVVEGCTIKVQVDENLGESEVKEMVAGFVGRLSDELELPMKHTEVGRDGHIVITVKPWYWMDKEKINERWHEVGGEGEAFVSALKDIRQRFVIREILTGSADHGEVLERVRSGELVETSPGSGVWKLKDEPLSSIWEGTIFEG